MLGVRLADGLALDLLSARARLEVAGLVANGLLEGRAALGADGGSPRALLTLRGRLLADAVIRVLTD